MNLDIRPPHNTQPEGHGPQVVIETQPKKHPWLRLVNILILASVISFGVLVVKAGTTFNVISEHVSSFLGIDPTSLPLGDPREKDRLDILVLGYRGEGDPHGGLLTDTMLVVSVETKKNDVAFISIPRDTYLNIPIVNQRGKINEAFALGEQRQRGGGGLFLAKLAAQEVLGVNIDHAIAIDFTAFKDIVDLLGGVDVNVAKPLHETQQWGGIDFSVPAGRQHMDGDTALLYARSRFTTSDFDRARRQQEVILAVRDKALSLGFLGNPKKIVDLLDILGRHIRTDISGDDFFSLFAASNDLVTQQPRRLVLDTSNTGLLYSTIINGAYVLLPAKGSFDAIHQRAQNIFNEDASLSPAPSQPTQEPSEQNTADTP